jgi:glycosyltransferase involved in cell wall biosynthesis
MNVAFVTPSYFPAVDYGGPTRSTHGLTRALAATGVQVRVLTTNAHGVHRTLDVATDRELTLEPNLRVRYAPRIAMDTISPALLVRLVELVRWADVLHLVYVYSFPTLPTLAAARAAGKPLVWTPRGALQRWAKTRRVRLKAVWNQSCKLLLPRAVALHVTSASEADAVRRVIPGAICEVIPNGVDVPSELPPRVESEVFRILFLGRLDAIKGIENLLAACALLKGTRTDFAVTIAGSGKPEYEAELRAHVARMGISDRVDLCGTVSDQEKPRLFSRHDVLVLPSFTENFGLVAAEALAHGVPVIASRGTPWAKLEEVGCGLWVDNTPEALKAALLEIWDAPLIDMGSRGRDWVALEYDWQVIAPRMLSLYQRVIAISESRGRSVG